MSSHLITIASFAQPADAYVVRSQLERRGVAAVIVDATTATTLWHLSAATGGAKLQVNEGDVEQARAILLEFVSAQSAEDLSNYWRCRDCLEIVDPGFDVCWSCSRPRSEVEDKEFEPTLAAIAEPLIDSMEEVADVEPLRLMRPTAEAAGVKQANPYLPSGVTAAVDDLAPLIVETSSNADELVVRAWRAAIMGLFICPPVLNLYSMYLLIRVSIGAAKVSSKVKRRFYAAIVINMLSGLAIGFYRWFEWLE